MELLAPAGNMEKLITAVHFGADAVYFSGKNYGLRAFAGNFSDKEILKAMSYLHERGKKGYVTLNISARDSDFAGLDKYLELLTKAQVDGLIVSDVGLIGYIHSHFPSLNIHVSTQANITNSEAVKFYSNFGVKRVVLARELSIDEIKNIHKNVGDIVEIEAFAHGAMCISYSGRCLLSNYLTGRESNRGACVQACRWKYFIREENRDDEYEMQEDERGTYILNSKDLNMISHLKEMEEAGITSIKIEGRMKSSYYTAVVVNAYRRALDSKDYKPSKEIVQELEKASHRKYTTGFYFGAKDKEYLETSMPVQTHEFVAVVVEKKEKSVALEMRNRFAVGETLEILSPDKNLLNKPFVVQSMLSSQGQSIQEALLVQEKVEVPCSLPLQVGDILRRKEESK